VPLVIHHLRVGIEEGLLQVRKSGVIKGKLPFERAIGHPPLALEHRDRLVEEILKGHGRSSSALALPPTGGKVLKSMVSPGKSSTSILGIWGGWNGK
jgi:hypothetical protein